MITGQQLIGGERSQKGTEGFHGVDPVTGSDLPHTFYNATEEEIDAAVQAASEAFLPFRLIDPNLKADFLEAIADEILALGATLIERGMTETSLPKGRLEGERGRTMNQLKLFAQVVREGSWVEARIDHAQPDRQPMPKADLRQMLQPMGPVGIFGASNFPLAFSVAGGDTASALAAGCPVVVKAHPAHPGTSELVGQAIVTAAKKTNMPKGVFSLVQGQSHAVGEQIVLHPLVTAIGFTGSFKGGKALFDLANQRNNPIPVYAEMGSSNPLFILPDAMARRGATIAAGLSQSINLGVGQFCTAPGLVVMAPDADVEPFKNKLKEAIGATQGGTMLTAGIKEKYQADINNLENYSVEKITQGEAAQGSTGVASQVFETDDFNYLMQPELEEEIFGPSTILIQSAEKERLYAIAHSLEGHLTATVHGTAKDFAEYNFLIPILEEKVGRIILNGFPTGVEVCHSMVHGGPFPATTAPRTTSVGTQAIKRFVRPICYQDFPDDLLPAALQNANPLKIERKEY